MKLQRPIKSDLASRNLTSSLLELFKQLIAEEILSPGDRLPPERELAEMVGVSRSSLRPALKVLEIMGVITQRVGSGTRLNPAAASMLAEPLEFLILLKGITFPELMEARLIVEPKLAARAALRASLDDYEALERAILRMEDTPGDLDSFVASDVEFHQAVSDAAGNRVLGVLFAVVHQSLDELIRYTYQQVSPEHTIRFHRRILTAIQEKDADAARMHMRQHLEDVDTLLARGADNQVRSSLEERLGILRTPPP